VLKGTIREFKDANLTDLAAALTYYGVLAIFPIIVIVSVLGLIGNSVTQPLIKNLGSVAPGPARQIFTSAIQNVQSGKGTAGILFVAAWPGRCGRRRVTSPLSYAHPTPSGTSRRGGRSGRPCRSGSASRCSRWCC